MPGFLKYAFSLMLILDFQHSFGAGPNKLELENARKAFPNDDAIFLEKNEHVNIEVINGELKISSQVNERVYFVTDKSDFYRKFSIYHSFFTEVSDIDASIETQVDGKYKEIKVTNFTTADNVNANIFYDDLKEVNFVFPAVSAGAVGRFSYNEKLKDPHFTSPFYFVSYMPIISAEYSVTCPSSLKLNYKVFNNDSNAVIFSKQNNGKTITYRWQARNVRKTRHEEDAPAFAYYAPHILMSVSEYDKDGKVQKMLPDLHALCEWYHTFVQDINKDQDTVLFNTVKKLTTNAPNEEEKIRRIYYWVQDNINYIAFEDGMNGFIPRDAREICTNRYGDCKDMSSILVQMLRMAGIKAYHTWIGSRRLPYRYSDMASPGIDDHMICVADAGGKRYVLDGTGKFTKLGFVTSFIQGKEALVMNDKGECEVYPIPIMPKESSQMIDTIVIDLKDKNTISGTVKELRTGYYKINSAYSYHYTQPEKREEKFQGRMKMGNNKCQISALSFSGFNGPDSSVVITAKYELPDYIKNIGEKIYLNPSLVKEGQSENIDVTDRKQAYEVDHKGIRKYVTIINIPEGYELNYIPENAAYKAANMAFSMQYESKPGQVVQTIKLETDFLILPVKELPNWNKMIETASKAYKENLVFKKK